MLGKRSQLMIFGSRYGNLRSLFDLNSKMLPPRGLKSDDFGGVGLGIVAALDISQHKVLPKPAVCTSILNRYGPIPVKTVKHQLGFPKSVAVNESVVGSPEDYTYVTYHGPNKTVTKVYYDDGGEGRMLRHGSKITNNNKNNNVCVFRKNPPMQTSVKAEPLFPTLDFLSSCHLCKQNLHGKDIYIYSRGEKAFCSKECRSSHIMIEELKEKFRSQASRSVELPSSQNSRDQMFSTEIVSL